MDQDKRKEIINSSETQEDLGVREDGVQVTGVQESGIQSESAVPHKRRVRYKGTHPRKFEEKYKEHQPEKYRDTIEKVISKGSTPAGMHISIMGNPGFPSDPAGTDRAGRYFGLRRPYGPYAGAVKGTGPYVGSGCRYHRDGKNQKAAGRKGIRAGYFNHKAFKLCKY